MYFGSMWKDYAVWQAAPWIAHRIGAIARVRGRVRQRLVRNAGCAAASRATCCSPRTTCSTVLVVAACRESYLLDYGNARSRFMFNFGDGAVAGLLVKDGGRNALLGCHGITDGSFSLQVKVPSGGSVSPNGGYRYPRRRRPGGDEGRARRGRASRTSSRAARARSSGAGATLDDVGYLCGIHMKPSMHRAIVAELGIDASRAAYLDDTGHMSGVDPLLALDRAARAGELRDGELVLLLAAAPATRGRRVSYGGAMTTDLKPGTEFGPSSWIEVPQETIDAFADATGDHQWIHVDPERAAAGPFGTTIGHGYLTLVAPARDVVRGRAEARRRHGGQLRAQQGALPGARPGRLEGARHVPRRRPWTRRTGASRRR